MSESVHPLPLYAFMMSTGTTLLLTIHYCAFIDKIETHVVVHSADFNYVQFNGIPSVFSEMRHREGKTGTDIS